MVALAATAGPAKAVAADVAAALSQTVGLLMDNGLVGGDDDAIAHAVCLDEQTAEMLADAEVAGLIADAGDPRVIDQYRAAYLDAVRAALGGRGVAATDAAGVVESTEPGEENVAFAGEPVTGTGVLRVTLSGATATTDIPVLRLATRWCLMPVSVQPVNVFSAP